MLDPENLHILIVDDELLARQRLEDLLTNQDSVETIIMAKNGQEAVQSIHQEQPDVVFLDVQMPNQTGLDVVETIGPDQMPVTIFVTAYDQYALKAFDLAAVDYLVKPFDDERFSQAFARAQKLLELQTIDTMTERLASLLQEKDDFSSPSPPSSTQYVERIAVEKRGQIRVVSVDQINYITASGPYAELHTPKDTHLIRERMKTLEARLNPEQFYRIHRSTIVKLDGVEILLHKTGGEYAVKLSDGTRLKVSRSRRGELEKRLGLDVLNDE